MLCKCAMLLFPANDTKRVVLTLCMRGITSQLVIEPEVLKH